MSARTDDRAQGLRIALDLSDAGRELMRQNLRRREPDATDEQIDALLAAWLRDRPSLVDTPGFRRRPAA